MEGTFSRRHVFASMAFCVLASMLVFELSGCQVFPNPVIGSSMPSLRPSELSHSRSTFERGIVFPRWGRDGFGPSDTTWATGLPAIHEQAGAKWLELPIPLVQDNGQSITVRNNEAPLPSYVHKAVSTAHASGYKIFMVPLQLVHTPGGWAESVQFTTYNDEATWFDSLFAAYKPYLQIAQDESVEQVSVGTELGWMQANASSDLWNHYIDKVASIYHGTLTYDTNWSEISNTIPDWMHNSHLNIIGVSEYIPLLEVQGRLAQSQIQGLWREKIQIPLDDFSDRLGKHLILSEIGYRDSWDTFWQTWDFLPHPPQDPQAQADAVNAALSLCFVDAHIEGTFFWGWQDTGPFDLAGHPAAGVIHSWYI